MTTNQNFSATIHFVRLIKGIDIVRALRTLHPDLSASVLSEMEDTLEDKAMKHAAEVPLTDQEKQADKLSRIKLLRQRLQLGLKEAKWIVDAQEER
jgi:ribosomal protein L7/L12